MSFFKNTIISMLAFIVCALIASNFAHAVSFTLNAEAGHFNAKIIGRPVPALSLKGTIQLTTFNGANAWPPAAYVGIQEGPNRNNSVQVLVIRNRESDGYLVVGYRVVMEGKEVAVSSVENVKPLSLINFTVTYKNGIATISINGRKPIDIQTPFKEVAPYASVSSGEAAFTIVQQ
jgi:hypothetical protein